MSTSPELMRKYAGMLAEAEIRRPKQAVQAIQAIQQDLKVLSALLSSGNLSSVEEGMLIDAATNLRMAVEMSNKRGE